MATRRGVAVSLALPYSVCTQRQQWESNSVVLHLQQHSTLFPPQHHSDSLSILNIQYSHTDTPSDSYTPPHLTFESQRRASSRFVYSRMRGAVGQQQQQPAQQQQQPQGYNNGVMPAPHQQYNVQPQQGQQHSQQMQQQHQHQQQHMQAGGSRRTTPTTPLFSPTHTGPVMGIHDCLQANGGKPLYLCQP